MPASTCKASRRRLFIYDLVVGIVLCVHEFVIEPWRGRDTGPLQIARYSGVGLRVGSNRIVRYRILALFDADMPHVRLIVRRSEFFIAEIKSIPGSSAISGRVERFGLDQGVPGSGVSAESRSTTNVGGPPKVVAI